MPELGESVHEGTVSRWLKKEGEFVKEDEPVVEIMTDKVNTELPSPATGILSKILIQEGGTVEVFHAMGIIEEQGAPAKPSPPVEPKAEVVTPAPTAAEPVAAEPAVVAVTAEKRWFTPVVMAIAKDQGLSESQLASIPGTGEGGRVTKKDVEAFIASSKATAALPNRRFRLLRPYLSRNRRRRQSQVPIKRLRRLSACAR